MKPPYKLTTNILNLVAKISEVLGKINSLAITVPKPKLRKKNHIRTIKSTLAIEGNTFNEEQITAILENKKVIGSKKEILEVKNAIALYQEISHFSSTSVQSFLKAHDTLMKNLIESSGKFRSKNVGILKGNIVKHVAPKPAMVSKLINDLLTWTKKENHLHPLVVSSIVHYEIEFIHPFEDGNGRIGRFWQTLLLSKFDPLFRFIPIESVIEKNQKKYYKALEESDKEGESTAFIEFMLQTILTALKEFDSETKSVVITSEDRLQKAKDHFKNEEFSRKDYMELFKTVSSATASRDLKLGLKNKILEINGKFNQVKYVFKSSNT